MSPHCMISLLIRTWFRGTDDLGGVSDTVQRRRQGSSDIGLSEGNKRCLLECEVCLW